MHSTEQDPLDDAPLLRSIPRTDPFVVPEGFFESLPQQVIARTRRPLPVWRRALSAWQQAHPALKMAGLALVIAVSAVPFMLNDGSGTMRPNDKVAVSPGAEDVDALLYDDHDLLVALAMDQEAFSPVGADVPEDELIAFVEQQDLSLELIAEAL